MIGEARAVVPELPGPLVPVDCDLRDFPFMPLFVGQVRDSTLAMRSTGDGFRAAVLLWCASWHQLPAASLPDDDAELANLAGYGRSVKEWKRVRDWALHGFVRCADGRLYHPIVAERALGSWAKKLRQRWGTEAARIKKANDRNGTALVMLPFEDWKAAGCPVGGRGDSAACPAGQGVNVPRDIAEKMPGHRIQGRVKREKKEEIPSIQPTIGNRERAPAPPVVDDFGRVCALAGFAPSAARMAAEREVLDGWLADWPGCDFERDVLDVVAAEKARKPGGTSSLARFGKAVLARKAEALVAARVADAAAARRSHHDAETPACRQFRRAIGTVLVAKQVHSFIDPVRLDDADGVMTIDAGTAFAAEYLEANFHSELRSAAARAGLVRVLVKGAGR